MPVIQAPERCTHELPNAHFTSLATPSRGTQETALWRVQILPNTAPTPHALTREELFYVIAGEAKVVIAGETHSAKSGDVIVIPKDTLFALDNAGSSTLELLCCFPVGGQAKLDGKTFTPPWAE
ncbi:MAG: cupin domain-containing protein [Polyangiaceae bacterium]|nr:cupin domain-containing protein [Polyangiaceae bacterium]